jgi:hypothetical protein
MGRPSEYDKRIKYMFDEIIAWREQGIGIEDIALKLNIAAGTMYEYQKRYPEFKEVLKHSKTKLVNNLKKSLWKEAMGFEYEEITLEESYLGTKKKITKKYFRSQPSLLIYALCNLDPNNFRRLDKEFVNEVIDGLKREFSDEKIKRAFQVLNEEALEAAKQENEPV